MLDRASDVFLLVVRGTMLEQSTCKSSARVVSFFVMLVVMLCEAYSSPVAGSQVQRQVCCVLLSLVTRACMVDREM